MTVDKNVVELVRLLCMTAMVLYFMYTQSKGD